MGCYTSLEIAEQLVRSSAVDLVVVDSVAALTPRAEIEGDMGDSHMGLQARLMSQGLRKLTGVVNKTNCTVIFINQLREKIGVMFGNPETTTGGRALKFYASVRMEVRKGSTIKLAGEFIGNETKVKIVKNKVAPPFKEVTTAIMFGKGIDVLGEMIDLAEESGIIDKAGAWYSYGDIRLGQGRENVKVFLNDHPEIMDEIKEKLNNENLPLESFPEGE